MIRLPSGRGRTALVVGATMWVGAVAGQASNAASAIVVVASGAALLMRRPMLIAVLLVGALSGVAAATRADATLTAAIPQGPGEIVGRAATDPLPFGDRSRLVLRPTVWTASGERAVRWSGPPIAVVGDPGSIAAGDLVRGLGLLRREPGTVRRAPIAGSFTAKTLDVVESAGGMMRLGNVLRARVQAGLGGSRATPGTALLAGFLIGDTTLLPDADLEALRRSGLTHFVAVSGSNVALFLGAWWILVAPFGVGARLRAASGLVALVVFVIVTRWEPSVVRAATMAGLVLGGRVVGAPVDVWTAMGAAVALLLAVSAELAFDVGFQLSVVATLGVIAGAGMWSHRSPRWLWTVLGATVSAQAAVIPLLLFHFGTVPLLSPVANLLAAPLVTAATALGGVGAVLASPWLVAVAGSVAGMVLTVARVASSWPQLDVIGIGVVGAAGLVARRRQFRPMVGVAAIVGIGVLVIPARPPPVPTVTFVDVGQGDAVLLRDPSGQTALIDGGRDPVILGAALDRYGIDRLDLLVVTHGDADHIGGLRRVFDEVAVDQLWVPADQNPGDVLPEVIATAESRGIPVVAVAAGRSIQLGEIAIKSLGPRRRYGAENNGSVVLWVTARGHTVLLAGDVEGIAQNELPAVRPDLLLIPHHGAGTNDLGWLEATVGRVAVISVGPNTYGHPDPEVVATLAGRGVEVHTTIAEGDISVGFR